MSIDLDVVSRLEPNLEACQELALFVCSPALARTDFAQLFVLRLEAEVHEFAGEYYTSIAASREERARLAQLVLGCAISVLFSGRLIDDWSFFPSLDARAVLYRCLELRHLDAEQIWLDLASLPGP